ncbi:MAG TPA: TolC family protein, partial [Longimicrobiaceae bacterium]|nr:TolC family protein [Longimicrobiaceae bacterium]
MLIRKQGQTAALLALAAMTAAPAAAQQTVPLSLATAVTVAADTAPQVRISALQTAASLGRLEQARSIYFPQIGGQASVIRQTRNSKDFGISLGPDVPELIGPYTIWDFRPTVSQTLFSPAGWLQAGAAKEQVAASRAQTSTTAQTAALQAGQAYVNAAHARATVAAREQD